MATRCTCPSGWRTWSERCAWCHAQMARNEAKVDAFLTALAQAFPEEEPSMISLADQIAEARRELALRKRQYPGLVKRKVLTEGEAVYYLKVQEAIVQTLTRLDLEQRQLPLFQAP
jgi:hypothetical protein